MLKNQTFYVKSHDAGRRGTPTCYVGYTLNLEIDWIIGAGEEKGNCSTLKYIDNCLSQQTESVSLLD